MTTALSTPAKFKACLTTFKELVLDDNNNNNNNIKLQYGFLLLAELMQRGIGVLNLLEPLVGKNDLSSIYAAIQSTAGKALLTSRLQDVVFPKPLLAASSAVAGMIAETCVDLLLRAQESLLAATLIQNNPDEEKSWTFALERCRDVQDERFEILLQLLSNPPEGQEQEALSELKLRLLVVAQGQYLGAASLQPDMPQMWKRSLDVVTKQQREDNDLLDAALPLQELIRIAQSKGNAKRVSELSLRLSESLLGRRQVRHDESKHQQALLYKAFVQPHEKQKTDQNLGLRAQQAEESLKDCDLFLLCDSKDDDDWSLRFAMVSLRIQVAKQTYEMEQLALELHTAAKNRSQEQSLEAFTKTARRRVLERNDESFVLLHEKACLLRDHVLSAMPVSSVRLDLAVKLLCQHMDRLEEHARSTGLNAAAKPVLSVAMAPFVVPILQHMQNQMDATDDDADAFSLLREMPVAVREMVESAAMAFTAITWMAAGRQSETLDVAVIRLCFQLLSGCLEMTKEQQVEKGSDAVVKSKNELDPHMLSLSCAHATAMSLVAMTHEKDSEAATASSSKLIQKVTDEAIAMSNRPVAGFDGNRDTTHKKFGTAFFQFLVAWSGMHGSPWSFCNVTQARTLVDGARKALGDAATEWGRPILAVESTLLDLGQADAEGGQLVGGFVGQAEALFSKVHSQVSNMNPKDTEHLTSPVLSLIKTHCLNGLARITLQSDAGTDKKGSHRAETLARDSLASMEQLRSIVDNSTFYLWSSPCACMKSLLFHVSVARQLVADSLLRASRPQDAQSFLEDAVRDAPLDFDAALALGAFRLRTTFFFVGNKEGQEQPDTSDKMAQTQLLKAAKLDTTKADPFALLGLWYERRGDVKRALGCYSKALLLDPPHPVAGRGILRLEPASKLGSALEAASNSNSPLTGWAWRALGKSKAMVDCNDELAVVCLQKALRCRDVECPSNESLGVFYGKPPQTTASPEGLDPSVSDLSNVWAELAGCYRRLGRYTAADRAFESANEAASEGLASSVICSWAQVELDLGLHDEATEKFSLVLSRNDSSSHPTAAYGQATALLALAQRDVQDGKGGLAFEYVKRAIQGLEGSLIRKGSQSLTSPYTCALKFLGDLYSFGAWLPPKVFADDANFAGDSPDDSTKLILREQLSFVACGECAYRAALQTHEEHHDVENPGVTHAGLICDHGTNKLLQAQLHASIHGDGSGSSLDQVICDVYEVKKIFEDSAKTFERAIEIDPLYPPAWCGLGCAVCGVDPLLSQHAFCRSLQLDKTSPDVWSNLAFLYATHNSLEASGSMMDALTQVADSPMMWIGRALLLERRAFPSNGRHEGKGSPDVLVSLAADAYRAALQVMKHPSALLGLSLTSRTLPRNALHEDSEYTDAWQQRERVGSYALMSEFLEATGGVNAGASAIGDAMAVEEKLEKHVMCGASLTCEETGDNNTESGASPDQHLRSELSNIISKSVNSDLIHKHSPDGDGDSTDAAERADPEGKSTAVFGDDLSISRRIVHDPENGKLWLQLTKNMARELISVTSSGSPKRKVVRSTLESTMLAADRSALLLSEQLVKPKKLIPSRRHDDTPNDGPALFSASQSAVSDIVNAKDVSDALSLSYWVAKAGSEISEELVVSDQKHFDLQRALIMCPDNTFARTALTTT